jgi:ATP-dependent exoDNAse (exonuclease V) alpha subunit
MLDYYIILKTVYEYLEENPDSELHIVFIGDKNQLEPIGIGNPYKELLNKIPLFKLTENFRAIKSPHLVGFLDLILNNTEKYNRWTLDEKTQKEYCKDIHFNFLKNREEYYPILKEKLIKLREKGIQPYNGKNEKECFQIISPWGSNSRDYQHVITCLVRESYKGDKSDEFYKKGDYVTFSKNAKGLFFNNDMGEIVNKTRGGYTIKLTTPIDESLIKQKREKDIKGETFYKEVDGYKITILTEDSVIIPLINNNYEGENKFLKSNYCRTVHSVQGLQFSHVLYVVPENTSFLNLNMNYTAYSRTKDKLYLIGNRYSFEGEHAKKGGKGINTILKFKHKLIEEIDEILSNEENTLITQNLNIERCLNIRKYKKFATWKRDFGIKPEGECSDCKKIISINNYHVFLKDKNGNQELDNMKCVCRWCFNKNR